MCANPHGMSSVSMLSKVDPPASPLSTMLILRPFVQGPCSKDVLNVLFSDGSFSPVTLMLSEC